MFKKLIVLVGLGLVGCGVATESNNSTKTEPQVTQTPKRPAPVYFIVCPSIQLATFDENGTYSGGSEPTAKQSGLWEVKVGSKKIYFSDSENWTLIDFEILDIDKATERCEQI
jgi:hypothetical protein